MDDGGDATGLTICPSDFQHLTFCGTACWPGPGCIVCGACNVMSGDGSIATARSHAGQPASGGVIEDHPGEFFRIEIGNGLVDGIGGVAAVTGNDHHEIGEVRQDARIR